MLLFVVALAAQATALSPSDSYAPGWVKGPAPVLVRSASTGLHCGEQAYTRDREGVTQYYLKKFLERLPIDFCSEAYSDARIGIAFSGGGYRAMLSGAGQLQALDIRTRGSTKPGHIGGLLQAALYTTGLSGGSWLLGSIYLNNYTTVDAILANNNLWRLNRPLFTPTEKTPPAAVNLYGGFLKDLMRKRASGFSITITDLWGRALARQFIDPVLAGERLSTGKYAKPGEVLQWSDMIDTEWFKTRAAPFPIIVVNNRMPIYHRPNVKSAIMEITPYELGTFDPDPHAFADLKYLGTPAYNGEAISQSWVASGLDNAGFLMGASSSLFDQIFLGIIDKIASDEQTADRIRALLLQTGITELKDLAAISPNPYFAFDDPTTNATSYSKSSPVFYIADGAGNGQNIPMEPLLNPDRRLDVIIAFDNGSADLQDSWPDGHDLAATYERQFILGNSSPMTHIPDRNTFLNLGLSKKPTFFGCDRNNLTDFDGHYPPLIVYVPNAPYHCYSNTSTFQLVYSRKQMLEMVQNGYHIATCGAGQADPEWPVCLACAITQRSRERKDEQLSPRCERCFNKYCWDGTLEPNPEKALQIKTRSRPLVLQN